jgi:alcohol dehydrogenase
MVRRGGRIVLAGLKGNARLDDFPVDKVVFREIELVGVLSAGWRPTELAIQMIAENDAELRTLCSLSFPLEQVTNAVRTLGREMSDGREPVHVTLSIQ